jgi:hypothetical protein
MVSASDRMAEKQIVKSQRRRVVRFIIFDRRENCAKNKAVGASLVDPS